MRKGVHNRATGSQEFFFVTIRDVNAEIGPAAQFVFDLRAQVVEIDDDFTDSGVL